ncbi:MAG TPA: STAS domain-containing protein [Vicinamibacterales bacterium]|nr:STAS domain-containing protein [Vicinamibacterales bacterium]
MQITTATDGTLATLTVSGTIDTRAAAEFEGALKKAVEGAVNRAILDFTKVDLITSAGIRVLVMFAKRLQSAGGGLALCALTPDVMRVFEISGLTTQFKIAATRADAMNRLKAAAAPPPPRGSKVSRLVGALLGGESVTPARSTQATRSPLSSKVAELLDKKGSPRK